MERHDEPVALKMWPGYQICLMVTNKRLIPFEKGFKEIRDWDIAFCMYFSLINMGS